MRRRILGAPAGCAALGTVAVDGDPGPVDIAWPFRPAAAVVALPLVPGGAANQHINAGRLSALTDPLIAGHHHDIGQAEVA